MELLKKFFKKNEKKPKSNHFFKNKKKLKFNHYCQCCGYPWIKKNKKFEMCLICGWQDIGQSNDDELITYGGPNHFSLNHAKNNFKFSSEFFLKDESLAKISKKFSNAFDHGKDLKSIYEKIRKLSKGLEESFFFNNFSSSKKINNKREKYFKIIKSKKIKEFNFTCPCCGYPTVAPLSIYSICPICNWEDDGQDDCYSKYGASGPNSFSLKDSRENFEKTFNCYGKKQSFHEMRRKKELMELFEGFFKKKDIDLYNKAIKKIQMKNLPSINSNSHEKRK